MNNQELAAQARRIAGLTRTLDSNDALSGFFEACEFLLRYAGENSAFYRQLCERTQEKSNPELIRIFTINALDAFARYAENGLHDGLSMQRQARLDVVSDFLEQAQTMLDSADFHAAVPAVIIGAALEEFLRNWVEDAALSLEGQKPSIDSYSNALRTAGLITKQDKKDITGWAGIRNSAAHGLWDEVADITRIRLMLEGVNLFMRQYSARTEASPSPVAAG